VVAAEKVQRENVDPRKVNIQSRPKPNQTNQPTKNNKHMPTVKLIHFAMQNWKTYLYLTTEATGLSY